MRDLQKGFMRPLVWMAGTRWGSLLARALYTPLDKLVYAATNGRRGLSPRHTVLTLTTTGARSGQPRMVPVLYLRDRERMWVMGSNYGQARHPAWTSNLLANPKATVQIGSTTTRVVARLASPEEKQAMMPGLTALYPAWKSYEKWTDRDFRLFCLEPEQGGAT